MMKYTLKVENGLRLSEVELWKHSRTQDWGEGGEGQGHGQCSQQVEETEGWQEQNIFQSHVRSDIGK